MSLKHAVGESIAATASQLSDSAEEIAQDAQAAIKDHAAEAAGKLSSGAGQFLHSVEAAITAGSEQLRRDGFALSASAVDGVSGVVREAASRVDAQSPAALGSLLVKVMRSNPVATCAVFAGAGFALAAFLRSRESTNEPVQAGQSTPAPGGDQ